MPGVWNVGNGYNVNTKKISSKLTFEVGERFTGKVVSKGEGKDVTVKLSDGWQFTGELDGDVNLDSSKVVKFEVEGFEDGKLKLKLVQDSSGNEDNVDENFKEVIEKEGLSDDDIDVLKNMVKHKIPLTRDNINQVKGLIQFAGKISDNPKEIDAFIKTYLQSKGIDANSTEGATIKDMLSKFLNEYKKLAPDDILAFIENDIDFSKENIESFNKLFKGNSSIEQILTKMNDALTTSENLDNTKINNNKTTLNSKLMDTEEELSKNNSEGTTTLASKAYNENDPASKKINILDVLKTLAGSEDSELAMVQKNAGKEIDNVKLPKELTEKLNNEQVVKLIKEEIGDSITTTNETPKTQAEKLIEAANKTKLEGLLSNVEGKEIKLTDSEFKAFRNLLNDKLQANQENRTKDSIGIQAKEAATANVIEEPVKVKEGLEKLNFNDLLANNKSDIKELIKNEMKDKINNIRDMVKNLISNTELKEDGYEKIMNLIKNNISDIKVFNSVSNEYYYLNVPITVNLQEYPCKLIIKDNRKDGKKIDKTNAKMVISVKTGSLGEVDGYLTLKNNKIDVNLKCDNTVTSILNKNKSKLADGLSTLGLFVNISVSEKEKPVDLVNCRNFFNDMTISAIDIKV